MRQIDTLVIHCSASPNGDSLFQPALTPVQVVDRWHQARGFHRQPAWMRIQNPQLKAIGYHFLIYTSGAIATGRHVDEIGAHVAGHNARSIGICMIGTDKFTAAQWSALTKLVATLRGQDQFAKARIVGHRDLSPDINGDGTVEPCEWLKICPGFDVSAWLSGDMQALQGHLLEVAP